MITPNMTKVQVFEAMSKMNSEDIVRMMNTNAASLKAQGNAELIEKAVITTAAMSVAGKLTPKQSERFSQFVFDLTGLTDNVRTYTFRNEQMDIEKIGVHSRVAVAYNENTDPGIRRGVTHSKVPLRPKKTMVPFEISDDYLLTNLEGMTVEQLIVRMMATQFANDLEDLYINGDLLGHARLEGDLVEGGSTSAYIRDEFMGLANGWLRAADIGGHIYDAANSANVKNIMAGALKALPKKYKNRKNGMRWLSSPDLMVNLIQNLSEGNHVLADQAFLGTIPALTPYQIPILEPSLFDLRPRIVEEVTFTGSGSTVALRYDNISDVVVTVNTLADTPTAAYVGGGTDYTADLALGEITHEGTGGIGATETVLVTYRTQPQLLLTYPTNLMLGIGQEITLETHRAIFRQANQWAMTAKVDVNIEEPDALVKVVNIQDAFI